MAVMLTPVNVAVMVPLSYNVPFCPGWKVLEPNGEIVNDVEPEAKFEDVVAELVVNGSLGPAPVATVVNCRTLPVPGGVVRTTALKLLSFTNWLNRSFVIVLP